MVPQDLSNIYLAFIRDRGRIQEMRMHHNHPSDIYVLGGGMEPVPMYHSLVAEITVCGMNRKGDYGYRTIVTMLQDMGSGFIHVSETKYEQELLPVPWS
jgi:hypothetical protein